MNTLKQQMQTIALRLVGLMPTDVEAANTHRNQCGCELCARLDRVELGVRMMQAWHRHRWPDDPLMEERSDPSEKRVEDSSRPKARDRIKPPASMSPLDCAAGESSETKMQQPIEPKVETKAEPDPQLPLSMVRKTAVSSMARLECTFRINEAGELRITKDDCNFTVNTEDTHALWEFLNHNRPAIEQGMKHLAKSRCADLRRRIAEREGEIGKLSQDLLWQETLSQIGWPGSAFDPAAKD